MIIIVNAMISNIHSTYSRMINPFCTLYMSKPTYGVHWQYHTTYPYVRRKHVHTYRTPEEGLVKHHKPTTDKICQLPNLPCLHKLLILLLINIGNPYLQLRRSWNENNSETCVDRLLEDIRSNYLLWEWNQRKNQ